jgi:hypothetical protein
MRRRGAGVPGRRSSAATGPRHERDDGGPGHDQGQRYPRQTRGYAPLRYHRFATSAAESVPQSSDAAPVGWLLGPDPDAGTCPGGRYTSPIGGAEREPMVPGHALPFAPA